MAIKRRRRGDHVYLEEWRSYRKKGKVVSEFVRYLGVEGDTPGKPKPRPSPLDQVVHAGSTRAGAVRLLWRIAEDLQIPGTIDRICGRESDASTPSAGRLLTTWAINRVLDPDSATQLGQWIRTTDLPILTGISPEAFEKDTFLRALDRICYDDPARAMIVNHVPTLDDALSHAWRNAHPLPKGERETYAYDLTDVLFFGVTCPLAVQGRNPDHELRPQVNVGVVVSRHDRMPAKHFVYHGNRNGSGTTRNLLVELQKGKIPLGLLIVDRGVLSGRMVEETLGMEWHLLGGLSKQLKAVKDILETVEIPERPDTFVAKTRQGGVYAVKANARLWGKEREVVVYANAARAVEDRLERNMALSRIGEALTALSVKGKDWSEAALHEAIGEMVGEWKKFVRVRVARGGKEPRVVWELRDREVRRASRMDGKYVLLCTDAALSAKTVVEAYFGKDFVEKVFRTLKTGVEVEPVRHRRERRVRAYLFVCLLAYRIETALRWKLLEGGVTEKTAEYQERLLTELSRVERTTVQLGGEARVWYLNVTDHVKDGLRRVGLPDLLREGPVQSAQA